MITHCHHCGAGLLRTWQHCRVCGAPRDDNPAPGEEADDLDLRADGLVEDDDPWADVFRPPPSGAAESDAVPSPRRRFGAEPSVSVARKRALVVLGSIVALIVAGSAMVLLVGDDGDRRISSPLGRACDVVAELDVETTPDEAVEAMKALQLEVEAVAEEGLDPTKDVEHLARSATDFDAGAAPVEQLGAALHGLVATCEVNDLPTSRGTTDLANALESFNAPD